VLIQKRFKKWQLLRNRNYFSDKEKPSAFIGGKFIFHLCAFLFTQLNLFCTYLTGAAPPPHIFATVKDPFVKSVDAIPPGSLCCQAGALLYCHAVL
jgi:hypothetical protein